MAYPSRRGAGAPGVNGADGKQVELQQSSGYVQWRYAGDTTWRNLMPLSMITGTDGSDGRTVDLQAAGGWIQWRHQGDVQWQNLVSMDEMRGADGQDGSDGTDGIDGRAVQLQKSATHIQWRLTGDTTWQNIVSLSELTGSPGRDGTNGTNGANNTLNIGTVTSGPAAASLTGNSPNQTLNLVLPPGAPGTNGTNGANGVGIASQAITYQQSASGTTPPTGTWTASIPSVTKGTYLWTRIVLTLTDGSSSTSYAVAYQASDGLPGTNGTNYSPGTAVARTVSLATPYQHTDLTKPFKVVVNARSTQTVTVAGLVSDKVELRVGHNAAAVAPGGAGGFSIGVWESGITGIALMVGAAVLDGGQLTADAQAGWYFQVNRVTGSNASIVSCFTQSMS